MPVAPGTRSGAPGRPFVVVGYPGTTTVWTSATGISPVVVSVWVGKAVGAASSEEVHDAAHVAVAVSVAVGWDRPASSGWFAVERKKLIAHVVEDAPAHDLMTEGLRG